MDEIASRVTDIVDESGPRAAALYKGTYSSMYQCLYAVDGIDLRRLLRAGATRDELRWIVKEKRSSTWGAACLRP
jgi:hypothetical protein